VVDEDFEGGKAVGAETLDMSVIVKDPFLTVVLGLQKVSVAMGGTSAMLSP
jgi:hypothetical protein